jgi:hypothetical protein
VYGQSYTGTPCTTSQGTSGQARDEASVFGCVELVRHTGILRASRRKRGTEAKEEGAASLHGYIGTLCTNSQGTSGQRRRVRRRGACTPAHYERPVGNTERVVTALPCADLSNSSWRCSAAAEARSRASAPSRLHHNKDDKV